jgi:hypothetical protein
MILLYFATYGLMVGLTYSILAYFDNSPKRSLWTPVVPAIAWPIVAALGIGLMTGVSVTKFVEAMANAVEIAINGRFK